MSNACTDLTLVLIGRPRYQGGPGLRVGSPEVGARLVGLNNPGRRRRTLRVCEWSWARLGVSQRSVGPRQCCVVTSEGRSFPRRVLRSVLGGEVGRFL